MLGYVCGNTGFSRKSIHVYLFMQNFDAILSFKNISFSKISCTLHDPIINVNWVSLQRRYRQTFEQQEMKYFVILKEVWTNTFKMQKF